MEVNTKLLEPFVKYETVNGRLRKVVKASDIAIFIAEALLTHFGNVQVNHSILNESKEFFTDVLSHLKKIRTEVIIIEKEGETKRIYLRALDAYCEKIYCNAETDHVEQIRFRIGNRKANKF